MIYLEPLLMFTVIMVKVGKFAFLALFKMQNDIFHIAYRLYYRYTS